jgi:hypothetical protein
VRHSVRSSSSAARFVLLAGCVLSSVLACGKHDEDPTAATPRASALAVKDGSDQSGPAGSLLAQPLRATATDAKSTPVPGAIVRFRVARGAETGTTLTDTIAVAGFDGTASVGLRLGTAVDTSIVEAFLPDQGSAVARFRATATPPPRLDEVAPASFSAGDTVRLRGRFFNVDSSGNTAFFASAKG